SSKATEPHDFAHLLATVPATASLMSRTAVATVDPPSSWKKKFAHERSGPPSQVSQYACFTAFCAGVGVARCACWVRQSELPRFWVCRSSQPSESLHATRAALKESLNVSPMAPQLYTSSCRHGSHDPQRS